MNEGERRRVVVVTGGGAGIGAAVAEELGRRGWHVVTLDPLVTLDGTEPLPEPEETTAGRILAAGGSAQASSCSVTDADGVRSLFAALVDERGALDAVINVAGITRPTGFATGTEADWRGVLDVHLGGYLNVLGAALPLMAEAGYGRILGVTSGSGWRPADAGAYSCAKRVVASLTWQLGRCAPDGVVVNAMSPIAYTRMVEAAIARAGGGKGSTKASGGLSFGGMPAPEQLGPLGAHLVGDGIGWCSGRVVFAGGSEVAVVDEPRLLEVVRTDGFASVAGLLDAVVPPAFGAAEAAQATGGGSNGRFGAAFDGSAAGEVAAGDRRSAVVVGDRTDAIKGIVAALETRGVACDVIDVAGAAAGFAAAGDVLSSAAERAPLDSVVVALSGGGAAAVTSGWAGVLEAHEGVIEGIHADAGWVRAVADHAAAVDRPVRVVTVTDAASAGGRSRAQAAAQLARVGRGATGERVAAFAVADEASDATGELVAHLLCHPEAVALAGAELAAGGGWVGLRSHPRPTGSISFGGPEVPGWFDGALRELAR